LDAIFKDVSRMVEDGEMERADHTYEEFDGGLRRHIRIEEEMLFPVFEQKTGNRQGPTMVMRSEHVEIRESLEQMRTALGTGDAEGFRDGRTRLIDVLPAHDMKEERVLYPMIDQLLTPEERADLVQRMKQA
jgi:hemerythrin-like domain-containing protein